MPSRVVPAAPFRVIARTMEALRGESTTLVRSSASSTSRKRSMPKVFERSMTVASPAVSGLGSSSRGRPGPMGSPRAPRSASATLRAMTGDFREPNMAALLRRGRWSVRQWICQRRARPGREPGTGVSINRPAEPVCYTARAPNDSRNAAASRPGTDSANGTFIRHRPPVLPSTPSGSATVCALETAAQSFRKPSAARGSPAPSGRAGSARLRPRSKLRGQGTYQATSGVGRCGKKGPLPATRWRASARAPQWSTRHGPDKRVRRWKPGDPEIDGKPPRSGGSRSPRPSPARPRSRRSRCQTLPLPGLMRTAPAPRTRCLRTPCRAHPPGDRCAAPLRGRKI